MKVDLMFNEVVTMCKRRVVEDVELDEIAQHLNDDGRYLDEFLLEHQYTNLDINYFEKDSDGKYVDNLLAEIHDAENKTKQQVLNQTYKQLAECVNDGWLDAKELGVLQLCIQNRLAKLKQ